MEQDYGKLISAAVEGDSDASAQLYERTVKPTYYTILKLVRNEQDAQDLTQEVYVKVFSRLGTLSDPQAFPKWVCTIAVNLTKDYLKKCRPVLFGTDEEERATLEAIPETGEDCLPAQWAEQADRRERLVALIDALSEEQRAAVYLYYFDELSIQEVAQVMEVNENTVKSRLNYARKKLRDQAEKGGVTLAVIPLLRRVLQADCKQSVLPEHLRELLGKTVPAGAAAGTAEAAEGAGAVGAAQGAGTAVAAGTIGTASVAAATAATATTAATAAGVTATTGAAVGAAAAGTALGVKIAAGVLTAALLVGGGLGVKTMLDGRGEKTPPAVPTQTVAPTVSVPPTPAPVVPTGIPEPESGTAELYAAFQVEQFPQAAVLLVDLTHDGEQELMVLYTDAYQHGKLELYTVRDGAVVPLPILQEGGIPISYDETQSNFISLSWPMFPINGITEKCMLLSEGGLDYLVLCSSQYRQGYMGGVRAFWLDENGRVQYLDEQSYLWDVGSGDVDGGETTEAQFEAAVADYESRAELLIDLNQSEPIRYRENALTGETLTGKPLGPKGDTIPLEDVLGAPFEANDERATNVLLRLGLSVWPGLTDDLVEDMLAEVEGLSIDATYGGMSGFYITSPQYTVCGVSVGMSVEAAKEKLTAVGATELEGLDGNLAFDIPNRYNITSYDGNYVFPLALTFQPDANGLVTNMNYFLYIPAEEEEMY